MSYPFESLLGASRGASTLDPKKVKQELESFRSRSDQGLLELRNSLHSRKIDPQERESAVALALRAIEQVTGRAASEQLLLDSCLLASRGWVEIPSRFDRNFAVVPALFCAIVTESLAIRPRFLRDAQGRRWSPVYFLKRDEAEIELFFRQTGKILGFLDVRARVLPPRTDDPFDSWFPYLQELVVTTPERYLEDFLGTLHEQQMSWSRYPIHQVSHLILDDLDLLSWNSSRIAGNDRGKCKEVDLTEILGERISFNRDRNSGRETISVASPRKVQEEEQEGVQEFDEHFSLLNLPYLFEQRSAVVSSISAVPQPLRELFQKGAESVGSRNDSCVEMAFLVAPDEKGRVDLLHQELASASDQASLTILAAATPEEASLWEQRMENWKIRYHRLSLTDDLNELLASQAELALGKGIYIVHQDLLRGFTFSDSDLSSAIEFSFGLSKKKRERMKVEAEALKSRAGRELLILLPKLNSNGPPQEQQWRGIAGPLRTRIRIGMTEEEISIGSHLLNRLGIDLLPEISKNRKVHDEILARRSQSPSTTPAAWRSALYLPLDLKVALARFCFEFARQDLFRAATPTFLGARYRLRDFSDLTDEQKALLTRIRLDVIEDAEIRAKLMESLGQPDDGQTVSDQDRRTEDGAWYLLASRFVILFSAKWPDIYSRLHDLESEFVRRAREDSAEGYSDYVEKLTKTFEMEIQELRSALESSLEGSLFFAS